MAKPIKPKKKTTFNVIEGQFDVITDNNFSYESVSVNKKLTIPDNHQMIVRDEFILEGELRVEGSFILED